MMPKRMPVLAIVLTVVLGAVAPARAACGDGILDPGEGCDDGAANGTDGCCTASCVAVDADGDGLCDALDACPGLGVRLKDTTLVIGRAPRGDRLHLRGAMTVENTPAIDPAATGVRLQMGWSDGFAPRTLIVDATLPPGEHWRKHPSRPIWTYRDPAGGAAGITRATLALVPSLVPSERLVTVRFKLLGRRGSYPLTPDMVTSTIESGLPVGNALSVNLALGAPVAVSDGQCGNVVYTTVLPTSCAFRRHDRLATCSGPPPLGPCHTGDPDDRVVCDVLAAANAEDAYFATHGTYFTGACADLPGFVGSPGVVCTAIGTSLEFVIQAAHPSALRSCTWDSLPPPGSANLVCS